MPNPPDDTKGGSMRLGYSTRPWGAGPPAHGPDGIQTADQLGLDSVWTSESYGADALTPLAWWGAQTSRVRLGTAIVQMSARTPTALGMAALTLDHLSGGRTVLGIGASGPQVVEGWYGQRFRRPLERTREYLAILRQVLARQEPVTLIGRHYQLPVTGGTGLGKPLRPILHPIRRHLPVLLAAEGPRNVALAAEIADGWIPMWFSPRSDAQARTALAEGFARSSTPSSEHDFEVVAPVWLHVADDVELAADALRPQIALYIGGMGAKLANFHLDVFARMGWADVCEKVQELYLRGDRAEAAATLPLSLVEDVALVGPIAKIREDLARWRDTVVTVLAAKCEPWVLAEIRDEFD
jgi:F420-dependent oxidoreductase-like protein